MQTSMNSNPSEAGSFERDSFRSNFIPPEHKYVVHEPFSSPFFRDHCEQEYAIHRAFNSNNFTYLRRIPDNLAHGAILNERVNKVMDLTESQAASRSKGIYEKQTDNQMERRERKLQPIGTLGYFQMFPYQESTYGIEKQILRAQKNEDDNKRRKLHQLDFRPAGFEKKMKFENPFEYVDKIPALNPSIKEPYLFPFSIPEDTYDRFHECEMRQRIIQESAKIGGEFIPSQNEKSLSKVSKSKLNVIIGDIEAYLKKYLNRIGFLIGVNKKDQIEILFDQKMENDHKVHLVLSKICEHQLLNQYMLKRNRTKWAKINPETRYLQFGILPPWAKQPEESLERQSVSQKRKK